MKKMFLGIFAAVLSISVCLGLCVSAFAEGTVIKFEYVKPGVTFSLYKIGSLENNRDFVVSDEFEKYSVNFESTDSAKTLRDYIERDGIKPKQTAVTDSGKTAYFEDVESGYYLIIGEDFSDGNYTYEAQPVLLTVYDSGDYYLDVTGKYEVISNSETGSNISVTAMKIWAGGTGADSITAQLLCDGEVYDEAVLNSENSWRHIWSGLNSNRSWSVVEKNVPSGYSVSVEKDGTVFIIQNTKDSADEGETETTTSSSHTGGGGGGGGSVIVNPTEATTEAAAETTTETKEEKGEKTSEDSGEEVTQKYNEYKEDDSDSSESGGENSEGETPEGTPSISESTLSSNLSAGQNSAAEGSSAGISSSAEELSASAGAESGGEASEASAEKLPQTGQLWLPVPFLCCGGILCLILGIGRKRMG